jgi:hypothetical protein
MIIIRWAEHNRNLAILADRLISYLLYQSNETMIGDPIHIDVSFIYPCPENRRNEELIHQIDLEPLGMTEIGFDEAQDEKGIRISRN